MKISDKLNSCSQSPMRKYHSLAVEANRKGIKIYHLNIGQPDIPTPPVFFDAVKSFSDDVLEYAPSCGISEMIDAVKDYYEKLNITYDTNDVYVTTGASEALLMTMLSILNPGDEVIIPEPFYPNYSTFVNVAGGKVVPITSKVEDGYAFVDKEKIQSLITPRTRAILFSNPGNPTGTVLTNAELRILADIAKENDLFIISDEAYREFVYGDLSLSSIGVFEDCAQNIIIIDSSSKRFSACGARIGFAITKNKELQQCYNKLCQSRLSVATLDQVASAALYNLPDDYFDDVRKEYEQRRDICVSALEKMKGVIVSRPQGAFYLMAKLPIDDADKFQTWLLSNYSDNGETVMLAPGAGFYATQGAGKQEFRIAYVLSCKNLSRAMQILSNALDVYNS